MTAAAFAKVPTHSLMLEGVLCVTFSKSMLFASVKGSAGSGGRADTHPGADGQKRQHERAAGQ